MYVIRRIYLYIHTLLKWV